MKAIVHTDWLILTVQSNRDRHRKQFEKALARYRERAIEHFEKQLEAVRSKKPFDVYVNLIQPVDQTKDYDRTINMLKNHGELTIEMTEADWKMYVLDEWQWTPQWIITNATYGVGPDEE